MEMRPAEQATSPGGSGAVPTDPSRRRRVLLVCVAAAAVLLAVGLWLVLPPGPPALTRADLDQAVQQGVEQAREQDRRTPPEAVVAYRTITPSLVTVIAQPPPGAPAESGFGSGVVINGDGSVLTALHVVEGAGQIRVEFADGTAANATVAAAQPADDVAVLAVDALPQPVVPAVMAGPPTIGETVFAVGNPLGLRASMSAGVVSAAERSITSERGTSLDGLIQFDAAVNPGNSGGPLLNRAGQVVGIVTALANPAHQDFFVGIGFAVPIATAGGAAGGPQQ
jgi:S1-C subfamily serine protease